MKLFNYLLIFISVINYRINSWFYVKIRLSMAGSQQKRYPSIRKINPKCFIALLTYLKPYHRNYERRQTICTKHN